MESLKNKLAFWLVITIVIFLIRSWRKKDICDGNIFLEIASASASIVLAISLILKVFQKEELIKILQEDAISLVIGAGAQILISINPELKEDTVFFYKELIKFNPFQKKP